MTNTPLQDIQELQTDAGIFDNFIHATADVEVDFSAAQDGSDLRPSLAALMENLGFGHPFATQGVQAAQTTALPACTYNNGAGGVGATITGNANGALGAGVFDGVAPVVNARVFVYPGGADIKTGIYVVTQVGDGTHPFILTRDANANSAVDLGFVWAFIGGGAIWGGFVWMISNAPWNITVGTTALQVIPVAGSTAVAGETMRAEAAEAQLQNGLKSCAASQTANFNLDGTAFLWPVNANAGNVVATVPAGAGFANQEWEVKKIDNSGNTVTVTMQGGETIDGAATFVLAAQWKSVRFVNARGGTHWYITALV